MFLDRVIHFGETFGDQVKGRTPKNLESLIEVASVLHMKVQVLSITEKRLLAKERVLRPRSYFLGKFG